jgi:hypothetical protein
VIVVVGRKALLHREWVADPGSRPPDPLHA